jgi:hypothetical protein
MFSDTWLLRMTPDLKGVKWEKRKKSGFAPRFVQNSQLMVQFDHCC